MGRTEPTIVHPPHAFTREARAKRARATLNKLIPTLLAAYPRAQRGINATELIVDPPALPSPSADPPPSPPTIRLRVVDTLVAAHDLVHRTTPPPPRHTPNNSKRKGRERSKVAILNMASPLRPGGGFLTGAAAQEESLCMRTTLLPALRESFYRLPDVAAVHTPDVLVFRGADGADLPKAARYFVDVVSAGTLRFPEVDEAAAEGGGGRYALERDREMVARKMRCVMRVCRRAGAARVVLGTWGCGGYGNPVGDVARAWRRVLLGGGDVKRRGRGGGQGESWAGIEEVVFAINDARMAGRFREAFGEGLVCDEGGETSEAVEEDGDDGREELRMKIEEMQSQITQAKNPDLKARMQAVVARLMEQRLENDEDLETPSAVESGTNDGDQDPVESECSEDEGDPTPGE